VNSVFEDYISSLTEDQVRNIVLIPLLSKMGFKNVIEYHGTAEKGKDIIARFIDMAGDTRYLAVVAKRGDIHGSVGKTGNAGEIFLQVQQSLDEPYTDVFDLKEVVFDECWVVTTGKIKDTAIESIRGMLKKSNLHKLVKLIDRARLITLIDEHLPTFWQTERHLLETLHEMRGYIHHARTASLFLERYFDQPDKVTPERIRELLQDISFQMRWLEHLIKVNYLFSSPEVNLNAQVTDITPIIQDTISEIVPLLRRRDDTEKQIELKAPDNLPRLYVDSSLISVALLNLLQNAVQYSKPGSQIKVFVDNRLKTVDILVQDDGIGVPDDMTELIMQPHIRAKNAMMLTSVGSGLGLTVSRQIAELHGGTLSLKHASNPTVFCLSLPKR